MTPLALLLVTIAGLFGLAIGSFLNVVVYRVPARIPLTRESRCPSCDTAIRPWQNVPVASWVVLRGRCAACHESIPARYPLVEFGTGLAFAAVTWLYLASAADQTAGDPRAVWSEVLVLVAFLYFAAISIALTLIDMDTHRLPDAIVLPSYAVAGILFTFAAFLGGDWSALVRAGAGMVTLYGFYFLLRLVRPSGMGGGDVKLAGVVGLYLGWVGWGALAVGAFSAFLIGGVIGLALILIRRATRKTAIPFGPYMLAGQSVGLAYLSLFSGQ
jgi:leader peptidase (prepilin peptidase)/N-methyltransferase